MSDLAQRLKATFLSLLPAGGATKGNGVSRHETEEQLPKDGLAITEEQYWQVHAKMVTSSAIAAGKRRGGSVRFADVQPDSFALATQVVEVEVPVVALKSQPKAALAKPIADRVRPCEETQVISFCRRENARTTQKSAWLPRLPILMQGRPSGSMARTWLQSCSSIVHDPKLNSCWTRHLVRSAKSSGFKYWAVRNKV